MRKEELLKVYKTLWSEYETICRAAGASARPSDGSSIKIDERTTNSKDIGIQALCFFPEWRYKKTSPKERIQILVQSRERYSRAENRISRSNVQVLYLRPPANESAQSLLALHYDYETPPLSGHPIFHAQFGMGDFPPQDLHAVGFRSTIKTPPKETLYSSVRIPTACMNFVSVLLGLAADHLEEPIFDQILKLVRKSDLSKWDAMCQAFEARLQNGGYLPSHHWY
ncbi:MAG: hypothetical protein E6G97_07400 [Alphaproteobacteria bacterium]|nr:MAG: hypothetical protein E6G97_07400 [Alphaproteobacteria bacterium]